MKTRPVLGPKWLIEKWCSGLWNSIVFSSKITSCNHSAWYSHTTLQCTAFRSQSQFQNVALLHVISCAVYGAAQYRIWVVILKIYALIPSIYSVLYNAYWRSSSLVKNLERQWRNGWSLSRSLAISVASQVAKSFSFSTWCEPQWRCCVAHYKYMMSRYAHAQE